MRWYDVQDFLIVVGIVLGLAFVVFTTVLGTAHALEGYACRTYSEVTGRKTQFRFIAGCFVETDSGWQVWDEYKARAIASEGLK